MDTLCREYEEQTLPDIRLDLLEGRHVRLWVIVNYSSVRGPDAAYLLVYPQAVKLREALVRRSLAAAEGVYHRLISRSVAMVRRNNKSRNVRHTWHWHLR
jgi:hypothetical protein